MTCKYYADFKYDVGFRCHPCEIIDGPYWDDVLQDTVYQIRFVDFIEGSIHESQLICKVESKHIFDTPIEKVDLPEECYWGKEFL